MTSPEEILKEVLQKAYDEGYAAAERKWEARLENLSNTLHAVISEVHDSVPQAKPELDSMPIEDLDLTVRAYNCLKNEGVNTVGDIRSNFAKDPLFFLGIRSFGKKSYNELREKLARLGIMFPNYP